MPIPNELTPEDEAAFLEHGMEPLGAGLDPVGETQEVTATPVVEGDPASASPAPATEPARGPDGKFLPKTEAAPVADPNAPVTPPTPPGFVPHAALHQERQERARVAQQLVTLRARTDAILAAQSAAQKDAVPDMTEDPVAYLTWLQSRVDAFDQTRAEEQQYRQVDATVNQDEEAFKLSLPEGQYEAASDHYVQSRARELLAFYPPEEVQGMMLNEVRQAAQLAWSRGQSVGQAIYHMAQARGFVPGQAAPQPAPAVGAAPATPQPAAKPGGPAATVAAVKRGMEATRSLSGGGAAPASQLNAEALLAMSDEEFDAMLKPGTKGANERFQGMLG